MPRFRWIALQGNSRGLLPPLLLFGFLITISGIPAHAADDQAACRAPFARIVSIQGTIELQRAGRSEWSKIVRLDSPLCEGDRLRTGARSRAALFIQPETLVRVDQNTRIAVNQTADETLVEFTQEDIIATSTDAHTCGAGYFITRFPRKFRVNTPHLNAAVEGTEFLVAMRCEATELSVFEGKVLAASAGANIFPSQSVVSGQTLTVGGSEPPAIKLHLKPADAVQWTLYYPPITPAGTAPVEDCSVVAQDNRVSCLIARAEQRLRVGRVDEAQANIGDALAIAPYSSDAKALSSIISLVRNDKAEALRLAKEAVAATANSAPAWLALSYAQQADFKLEAALTSAQRASELTPSSALAFARVAELQLSLGWTREAEKTAKQAVAANPLESRAHMILGFVHLAQIKVKEAREDFGRAIENDSTDPLSRLGLGLAIIRKAKLVEGREQIEIAVALDPTNSLIRSYVGKAYYEENSRERDSLAAVQFGLAKDLDPKDPTPWFYDAILNQTQNRPAEALQDIRKSITLNDNRAVYRSRLSLDEDAATRTITMARTYDALGFEQLSLQQAARSLDFSPEDHTAHRFLSDSYVRVPRHEVARVSELLQSQLLQPLSSVPVQPCLTENDFLVGLTTSLKPGYAEFMRLFERDGPQLYLSGLAGDHGRAGQEALLSGTQDRVAYSVGACRFDDEGFRDNQDFNRQSYNGFAQVSLTQGLDVQAEWQRRDTTFGDLGVDFDPSNFSRFARNNVVQDMSRIGLHLRYSPQAHLLASIISTERNERNLNGFPGTNELVIGSHNRANQAEMQYIGLFDHSSLTVGAGTGRVEQHQDLRFTDFTVPFTITDVQDKLIDQVQLYVYGHGAFTKSIAWTLGATFESLKNNPINSDRLNPKVGLRWQPVDPVSFRFAAFRTTKRFLTQNQTIEPTEIAGFNQFFDDVNGTRTSRVGIGMDVRLRPDLYIGAEASKRRLDTPILIVGLTGSGYEFEPQRERLVSAYMYWQLNRLLSIALDPSYEEFERDPVDPNDPLVTSVKTLNIPVVAKVNLPDGLSASLGVRYVQQKVDRPELFRSVFLVGSDSFTLLDASVAYKLPRRKGILSIEVRNITDERFVFRDDNYRRSESVPTSLLPERSFWVRASLLF